MKKFIVGTLMATIVAWAGAASATPVQPGPYLEIFGGATFPRSQDTKGADFVTGTPFNEHLKFDTGYTFGGAFGYDFGFMRLEAEGAYKNAKIKSVVDSLSGDVYGNVGSSLGVIDFMGNIWLDLHNPTMITPYVGGGAGIAIFEQKDTFANNFTTGLPVFLYPNSDDTVFAYQAGAGFDIAINRYLSMDLGYRYFGTEKARFNGNFVSNDLKWESHNAILGFKVKF